MPSPSRPLSPLAFGLVPLQSARIQKAKTQGPSKIPGVTLHGKGREGNFGVSRFDLEGGKLPLLVKMVVVASQGSAAGSAPYRPVLAPKGRATEEGVSRAEGGVLANLFVGLTRVFGLSQPTA